MKKLTDKVKQEILRLYRQTDETTSSLSQRYEVSNSTISRFLKTTLEPAEYDFLIQSKKRSTNKVHRTEFQSSTENNTDSFNCIEQINTVGDLTENTSDVANSLVENLQDVSTEVPFLEELDQEGAISESLTSNVLDYLYEDEEDEDDDEDEDDLPLIPIPLDTTINLQVLPINAASFPKTCYLVTDRSYELVTRPLKDFAQLGKIPSDEFQQKTLPVFDNHKVAKRFSNRSQRVIKVPDGKIFQKASGYLRSKGIARLLIDGQIYSLNLDSEENT